MGLKTWNMNTAGLLLVKSDSINVKELQNNVQHCILLHLHGGHDQPSSTSPHYPNSVIAAAGAQISPEVGADPFAILWFPRVRAVIRDLFDSSFIHWREKEKDTEGSEREELTVKIPKLLYI